MQIETMQNVLKLLPIFWQGLEIREYSSTFPSLSYYDGNQGWSW